MNRNTEEHFAHIPEIDIGRSKFDRSKDYKTDFNTGDIVPIFVDATIMPGDTVKMNMGSLIRMTTPIAPVMDNIWCDTYFFFVPHRLVWDHFQEFMGENTNAWKQTQDLKIPKLELRESGTGTKYGVEPLSLLNYMGIPMGLGKLNNSDDTSKSIKINHLPIRAYCKIWNDWFRDQNTEKELYFAKTNSTTQFISRTASSGADDKYTQYVYRGARCAKANRIHDYFSSALPEPQKGPATLVPLVGSAPIKWGQGKNANEGSTSVTKHDVAGTDQYAILDVADSNSWRGGTSNTDTTVYPVTSGTIEMVVDMENAVGATVNAIRQAFAIQKFYERQARGGTRYIEMVQSHFNVTNPDYRLQRSEYLGGKRFPISINQVVQTVGNTEDPLGNTGAYSVTSDSSEDMFTASFTEHGTLIGLAVVRTSRTYQQGIDRQWFMSDLTDFYFPEFANLGEMPIYNKEIFAQEGDNISQNDEVFGYQEAWAHYRYMNDQVTGTLSSMHPQSEDIWHFADYYSTLPTLNPKWELETENNVKRTLVVQNGTQFIGDFYFNATYTRPMPLYSVPGLVDHH